MDSGTSHTKPEVFILESLTLKDEEKNQRDGMHLSQALSLYNKNPVYYYFRTERELQELIKQFKASGYRYLHISCHGSASSLRTTFETITYAKFGQIVKGALNNRRLFVSACDAGNSLFSDVVYGANPGLYSVLAPSTPIHFNRSAAFWSAFYFLMFDIDSSAMKRKHLTSRLETIATLFDVSMFYAWNSAHEKKFKDTIFAPDTSSPISVHSVASLKSAD